MTPEQIDELTAMVDTWTACKVKDVCCLKYIHPKSDILRQIDGYSWDAVLQKVREDISQGDA